MRCERVLILVCAVLALSFPALAQQQAENGNDNLDLAPDEVRTNLVKILRTTNKAQTNRYVPKVYDFEKVNPYTVLRFARRVMEIEEGAWFVYANPDLTGGKLLVSCPEYQIPGLDALMEVIDREGLTSTGGSKRFFYRARHRNVFDPGFQQVVIQEGTPALEYTPDTLTNSALIADSPSGSDRISASLATYDQPTPQLEALVTVYEVDVSSDGQLGLDYMAWKNGPGRNLFAVGAFAGRERISTLDGPGTSALLYQSGKDTQHLSGSDWQATGRNGAYFYDLPSAYFDFLVTKGRARILTQSKLVVLDRRTGLLEIGEDILYYREYHQPDLRAGSRLRPLDPYGDLEPYVDTDEPDEITDLYNVRVADHPDNRTLVPELTARALGEVSTGFFLLLTPSIHEENCELELFMSYVNHTGFADDGTPLLASREIETSFFIPPDNREITIGGLARKRRTDSANKMPWLGDIPILGYLFGGESHLDQQTLVMTTLSCRVVGIGEATESDADRAVRDRVEGELDLRTPQNDPGFIRE